MKELIVKAARTDDTVFDEGFLHLPDAQTTAESTLRKWHLRTYVRWTRGLMVVAPGQTHPTVNIEKGLRVFFVASVPLQHIFVSRYVA